MSSPNHLAKIYNTRNHIYGKNFKLKLCTCTKFDFQLEILIRITISAIQNFERLFQRALEILMTHHWFRLWFDAVINHYLNHRCRAANQYGTSVFCTDFTCKIREYEFGLQNTEIELCQFCHLRSLLPEQSLPVLGSKSVKICGILCLKTFKYLFNHQNIHSSLFHMQW